MKTIFIICKSKAEERFWKIRAKESDNKIFIWTNKDLAIQNFFTVHPDIVLIDDYFSKEYCRSWMKGVLKDVQLSSYGSKIYCLSPRFCFEEARSNPRQQIYFNSISVPLLQELNLVG